MESLCPCCSGLSYSTCCERLHKGEPAQNALELMRSRYSAYAKALPEYIIRTTHPLNVQFQQDKATWSKAILEFCQNTNFEGLQILEFIDGDPIAYVTFFAKLSKKSGKIDLSFKEKSLFEKLHSQWLYKQFV